MRQHAATKGSPIVALASVLTGWVLLRVVVLAASGEPFPEEVGEDRRPVVAPARLLTSTARQTAVHALAPPAYLTSPRLVPSPTVLPLRPAEVLPPNLAPQPGALAPPRAVPVPAPVAVGHLALWMAAFAQLPSRDGVLIVPSRPADTPGPAAVTPASPLAIIPASQASRWSGDGWLLWRANGSGPLGAAQTGGAYGASQTGAVLRYRLAPANSHRPTAYLRLTGALGASAEREVAAGFGVRPFARVPVSLNGELRVFDSPATRRVRPALTATTELPPAALPGGFRLEAYGQTGWVGGRDKTAFVDGLARTDCRIARIGKSELRLGAGIWGGAQKGAARLDVGPSASLALPLSRDASARLALDWRWRVAGQARPPSGPALTLSAGF